MGVYTCVVARVHLMEKSLLSTTPDSISIPTIIAVITFFAAPLIGYYSAQASTASAISEVKTDVLVVSTKQEVQNEDATARLDRIEKKVDKITTLVGGGK